MTQDNDEQTVTLPLRLPVLMCVFNEEECIEKAITEVLSTTCPCDIELIVVDDGSTDDDSSPPWSARLGAASSSLTCLRAVAWGTHIIPFDADLEYSSDDILRLIDPVIKRNFDVVYGTRIFGLNTVYQSYRYAAGNRLFTRIANIPFDADISDLHTCLKLVSLPLFRQLTLSEPRFGLDTELTATLLRLGVRPFEVPVSYYGRSHAQGKKIGWRDAIACVAALLKVRLRRRKRLFATQHDQIGLVAELEAPSESHVANSMG